MKPSNSSNQKGFLLSLSRILESDEELNVYFKFTVLPPSTNTEENSPRLKYAFIYPAKLNAERNKIIIEPFSLDNFVVGKATVSVTVSKKKAINNSGRGVSLNSQFQSTNVAINIKS